MKPVYLSSKSSNANQQSFSISFLNALFPQTPEIDMAVAVLGPLLPSGLHCLTALLNSYIAQAFTSDFSNLVLTQLHLLNFSKRYSNFTCPKLNSSFLLLKSHLLEAISISYDTLLPFQVKHLGFFFHFSLYTPCSTLKV